jgi:MFS family permease
MKTMNPAVAELPADEFPWRAIVCVVACVSIFAVTLGLTLPLLSFMLESRRVHTAVIGANAAMTPIGLLLSAPLILPLVRRLGEWRLGLLCMGLTAASILVFKLTDNLAWWFAARIVCGMAIGVLFSISEAWITALAPAASRGRIVGVYMSILAGGFAAGPFLLAFTGSEGWTPFVVAFVFVAVGALPLAVSRRHLPPFSQEKGASIAAFARVAPYLLSVVMVVALFDSTIMSLLPVYGLRHGLSEATAAITVGVLIFGNVLLQPLIGGSADRVDPRVVLFVCMALGVAGGLALPVTVATVWQWPVLLVWGGAAFGIYTVCLIELGRRFTGTTLIAGVAAFSAMWGVGGMIGPPVGGVAMEIFGPDALPVLLAAMFALLAMAGRCDR